MTNFDYPVDFFHSLEISDQLAILECAMIGIAAEFDEGRISTTLEELWELLNGYLGDNEPTQS